MLSAAVVSTDELAHLLDEPDLIDKLHSFSADQIHASDTNSDVSLVDDSDNQFPEIDNLITLYPSAVAIYFAPSDLSGIGGMHSERIRATANWRNEGPRYDTVFVNMNPNEDGMRGLDIARVKQFFSFRSQGRLYPCAIVQWYSRCGDEPDEDTGMWIVEPDVCEDGKSITDIIHLDTIICAAHLLPVFKDGLVSRTLSFTDTLDKFHTFYANKYVDHPAFQISF